ncbi:MAG: pyridoxal 5'-phosphate synthase glutaminase subunit PdxT, partial [Candidatus Anstonellaceae archaeon]
AVQGDVSEHYRAMQSAKEKLAKNEIEINLIRKKEELKDLEGLIIPGGESTTIYKLIKENNMEREIKTIKNFLVTCAGLILIAKRVEGLEKWQKTLNLLDIELKRNAYGSQIDSFYAELEGKILNGKRVAFIRAPKIKKIGKKIEVIAKIKNSNEIAILEQSSSESIIIGATCHPELDYDDLELYFLKKILENKKNFGEI